VLRLRSALDPMCSALDSIVGLGGVEAYPQNYGQIFDGWINSCAIDWRGLQHALPACFASRENFALVFALFFALSKYGIPSTEVLALAELEC
jgi:hypothetical protein